MNYVIPNELWGSKVALDFYRAISKTMILTVGIAANSMLAMLICHNDGHQ